MSNYQTPESFYLKVVGTTGIIYKIYFDNIEDMTVEELKAKVSEKMYINSNVFQLTYNGKILDEKKKLSVYDIKNESTIICIESTLGGKFVN